MKQYSINSRLAKIKQELKENELDAVLISSISNIIYLTGFSGFSQKEREGFLLITKNKRYIITDGRYSKAVIAKVEDFKLIEISSKLSLDKILENIAKEEKIKKIGIEEDNLTVKEFKHISKHCNNTYYYSVKELRTIKDPLEILAIEQACKLTDKAFKHILNKIKSGVSEKEIAFEIEYFIKKQGADISFAPIVAFGKNSATPHHKAGEDKLNAHNIILLDFGAQVENYCSDITRTVFFGKVTNEQKKMYQTVLYAQNKAIEFLSQQYNNKTTKQLNNKIKALDVDKIARDYIVSQGYPTIPHSLGHGVGIEVHEYPRLSAKSKDILKSGMVFSIEPGIYIPDFGGVRIEDLVVLEKSGPKLLTHSKRELVEL